MFEIFSNLFQKLISLPITKIPNMLNKVVDNVNKIELKILSKITLQLSSD